MKFLSMKFLNHWVNIMFFMLRMSLYRFNNKIFFNILKIIFNFKGIQNIFYLSIFLIKKQLTKIYK